MPKSTNVTEALRNFAAAMESIDIPAADVEVSIPYDGWQRLGRRLDEEAREQPRVDRYNIQVGCVRYLIRAPSMA